MATAKAFRLADLDDALLSVLPGMDSDAAPALATAADQGVLIVLTKAQARAMFKFQTDALDVDNVETSDVTFTTDVTQLTGRQEWTDCGGNIAQLACLDPAAAPAELANAAALYSNASYGTIDGTETLGLNVGINKEFPRHLAKTLFNNVHATDLFNNEAEMKAAIVTKGLAMASLLTTEIDESNDTTGASSSTNAAAGKSDLARRLFENMINHDPTRFKVTANGGVDGGQITDTALAQGFPLIPGDTLSFRWSISPDSTVAAGGSLIVGHAGGAGIFPLPATSRVYNIIMAVVA